MSENLFLEKLSEWLMPPPTIHPDVVNKPTKLFRYHGGYKMFRGQKPRMVNPPKVRAVTRFHTAHP